MKISLLFFAAALAQALDLPPLPDWYDKSALPPGWPVDAPDYMVDNRENTFGVAPDKGSLDKPVTGSAQQEQLMQAGNSQSDAKPQSVTAQPQAAADGGFWYSGIAHGIMPFAPDGYLTYRDVIKDFGAKGNGHDDDTAAINRAVSWLSATNSGERCGKECGQTTKTGAVVYFPTGTYLISSPIIQYYFTQFVGDANQRPTIVGSANFTGIALIDCDPYIPGGNGANWYINQNQFFRQIRNIKFDLTQMPNVIDDAGQKYAPTGIHWQVSQAASLQNLDFIMPQRDGTNATGIFMENGSGGFVSDLYFEGGNIGFRAGSQQYTARNLKFRKVHTAISMIWDWGFTWQGLDIEGCNVALECTSIGGIGHQGAGSISVIDSHFKSVPFPIVLRKGGPFPNIILDNVQVELSASVVIIDGGEVILAGSQTPLYFNSWGKGRRYSTLRGSGKDITGFIDPPPQKPMVLLDGQGNIFARSKPTYADVAQGDIVVVTDHGVSNGGDGDQTKALNQVLKDNVGKLIYFPSGIYLVQGTVEIPIGSKIIGELWPQIMGTGSYFGDEKSPKVVVKVGNPGDSGVIEISDMLFTVKGPTRGAVVMEWNVREDKQGSVAMWDSHFRVGGAFGSDLTSKECPKSTGTPNRDCMAAALVFHITPRASGYFENVWVWTADHDMDIPVPGGTEATTDAQINIYTGRGMLIESEDGPCWFYGTGSEHHQMYQYQILNAKNIYMTHIQTESPYYQPSPDASKPYTVGKWDGDPPFRDCASGSACLTAWALRVVSSRDVFIYSAGLYSFFSSYNQACVKTETCQERLLETSYTQGFWLYNLFTKGGIELVTPRGGLPAVLQSEVNQSAFTSEVSAWLALALQGGNLGGEDGFAGNGTNVVYIDPVIWVTPSPTMQCYPPCTFVLPPSTLKNATVLTFGDVSTSLVVGGSTITKVQVPTTTVTVVSFSTIYVAAGQTSSTFAVQSSFKISPIVVVGGGGSSTTVTVGPLSTAISTSFIDVATLPTTVTKINGVDWTFSMDQFTDLATYPLRTKVDTTLKTEPTSTGVQSSTTSGIIFPIWVAPGGFYWSPVYPPNPTPPPLPPRLPEYPPRPNPPCFKFLDLFSIDCPPDKNKPTTHFTSGPPKPTCRSKCGKLDQDDEDDKSSTCKTATSTNCFTRDNSVACHTFVGCGCETKTVTDAWVSCNDQTCTTTKTQTVTGCYITASKSTVGEFCPTPVPTDPTNYDDGSDGSRPDAEAGDGTTVTTTYSPTAIISSHPYIMPSGGTVVIGGTTVVAPTTGGPVTTTAGGTTLTLVPGRVGPSVVMTNTGISVIPPSSTGPPPWEPTSSGPPDRIYISLHYIGSPKPNQPQSKDAWTWFQLRKGENPDPCHQKSIFEGEETQIDPYHPPFPPIMVVDTVEGQKQCEYIAYAPGEGPAPGNLDCGRGYLGVCDTDQNAKDPITCRTFDNGDVELYTPPIICFI